MFKAVSRQFLYTASSMLLAALIALPAHAQPVPDAQLGTASPGRVDDQVQQQTLVPRVMPQVEVRDIKPQNVPPGAEKINFRLDKLNLEGVTVYSDAALSSIYNDKLGQVITLADLYGIAATLTRAYRNDGYILTQVVVPPQTIDGGVARLQVVEGYVNSVKVRDSLDQDTKKVIHRYTDAIVAVNEPLNVKDLERGLLLVNDLPGVSARAILSPSATQSGAAELLIIVERSPYDALLAVDNHGTRFLGPVQFTAAGSLNSFFGKNERITGQFVLAPDFDKGLDNELYYAGLSYKQPLSWRGSTIEVFGSLTRTNPGFTLKQFDVEGKSQLMGVLIEHPFVRTRTKNLTGRVGFDLRNVDSSNNIENTREDRIRSFRIGGRYDVLDTIFGVAYNVFDIQLSQGLSIFGTSSKGDPTLSRLAADPNFLKANAEYQRLERLTQELNMLFGITGQWASDALFASEEFGVGGQNYGRGYDSSEIIGDRGMAAKLELQWNQPQELGVLEDYQLYAFYDFGRIWNTDPIAANLRKQTLSSAGVGIRADFSKDVKGGLMVALPISATPQTTGDRDPRVYVNLQRTF